MLLGKGELLQSESHSSFFISRFGIEWIKKPGQRKRVHELTKLSFIEAAEIQFDVDFVNIDPGIQDFSSFMVCVIKQ